jgi:predicted nucleotidyltransferase
MNLEMLSQCLARLLAGRDDVQLVYLFGSRARAETEPA